MKVLLILSMLALTACTQTAKRIDTSAIHPDRPAAISCPPANLKKVSENVYQTDAKGYQNLKACLSDVVRYVEETNSLYVFFTSKPIQVKKAH